MNLAIVAIPSQDDYVWQISSEKVPHLTLCYLGDQSDTLDVSGMIEFLGHVVNTSMRRFGLSVDRRGELGADRADVLFFDKTYAKMLEEVRAYLLTNRDIFKAYHSTDQYPTWTPHLTLGFPETPAKPDKRDYPGTQWVNFDRVALWTGDYEGPEFLLKNQDYGLGEVSMSATVDEIIEHFGIRGMKWGVRRSQKQLEGASEDFKSAVAAGTKAKSGGTKALSNTELQAVITRMNLEQQYSKVKPSKVAKTRTILKGIFIAGKTVNDALAFANSPAGKIVKQGIKDKVLRK